ncbi:MAG TPA: EF-P lysine aminoacylase EpmA [Gammaproteobacteria bacterium]|nr:EF-P lysine aminoacylase EpmA [Gammaproteobacteria bacterium]
MSDSARDWLPVATRQTLAARAELMERLRVHFRERGILEVETPLLSRAGSPELHIESLEVPRAFPDRAPGWLIPSPEFHLKRLLASGSGDVFSVARVFRAGEYGRLHNVEFTLVEWYRLGAGLDELMDDIEALLAALLPAALLTHSPARITYREAFLRHAGVDPFAASLGELRDAARDGDETDRDTLLDRIAVERVYPRLGDGRISLIHDFPASQASLARIRPGIPPVAERVEALVAGIELVNGFVELADCHEQRRRFDEARAVRTLAGRATPADDERFLAALEAGLPACAGAALGFDRLAMLAFGATSIADVLAFPADRA